jgi:hypothetical protein
VKVGGVWSENLSGKKEAKTLKSKKGWGGDSSGSASGFEALSSVPSTAKE